MKKTLLIALLLSSFFSVLFILSGCEVLGPQVSYPAPFDWKWSKDGKEYSVQVEVDGLYRMGGYVTGFSGIATNTSAYDLNGCIIRFDVLDKDGVKVCDAVASTQSLKAGMKWRFQAGFMTPFSTRFSTIKPGSIQAY